MKPEEVDATGDHRECVLSVLRRKRPSRFVYAPNYWQWFAHHRSHGRLPADIAHCRTQLDVIRQLGLDVFSRNIYCDEQRCWFGGLSEEIWDGVEVREEVRFDGPDRVTTRTYTTPRGTLSERLRYVFAYVRKLFTRLAPYAHRFLFAASCNTAIDAPWETLQHFRDAWQELAP